MHNLYIITCMSKVDNVSPNACIHTHTHTHTHTHLYAGKPFSAIPILTSTTGFFTNTQTPYTRLPQPDRQADLSSSASAIVSDTSLSSAAASLKLNESHSEVDFDTDTKRIPLTSLYPSDAKYPGKHGAATLFLADCLSSKHKENHSNH